MSQLSLPERDSKAQHPSRAQLDPGTAPPFKHWGLFYCSHFEKSLEQASLMSQISRQDLSKRQVPIQLRHATLQADTCPTWSRAALRYYLTHNFTLASTSIQVSPPSFGSINAKYFAFLLGNIYLSIFHAAPILIGIPFALSVCRV